jgi:hypothetical protein
MVCTERCDGTSVCGHPGVGPKKRASESTSSQSGTSQYRNRADAVAIVRGKRQLNSDALSYRSVFWLVIIFASFSLFAEMNATVLAALCTFALSTSGAIFLILELDDPFTGLMSISSAPLRNDLGALGS